MERPSEDVSDGQDVLNDAGARPDCGDQPGASDRNGTEALDVVAAIRQEEGGRDQEADRRDRGKAGEKPDEWECPAHEGPGIRKARSGRLRRSPTQRQRGDDCARRGHDGDEWDEPRSSHRRTDRATKHHCEEAQNGAEADDQRDQPISRLVGVWRRFQRRRRGGVWTERDPS